MPVGVSKKINLTVENAFTSEEENLQEKLLHIYEEEICLHSSELETAKNIYEDFIRDQFIPFMKYENHDFSLLLHDVKLVGSIAENLRVGQPTEFDINLVLRLPRTSKTIIVNKDDALCGFAYLECDSDLNDYFYFPIQQFFKKQNSGKSIFSPKLLTNWFAKIVESAVREFHGKTYLPTTYDNQDVVILTTQKNEPAITLTVTTKSFWPIKFDLVPVICVGNETLVPKCHPKNSKVWRLSYPVLEKKILENELCAQMVIKLLKCLISTQTELSWIKSYYIKNLVMLELKNSENNWNKAQLSNYFMCMMEKLHSYLQIYNLPYVRGEKFNLLFAAKRKVVDNARNRMKNIRSKIVIEPEKYFKRPLPC